MGFNREGRTGAQVNAIHDLRRTVAGKDPAAYGHLSCCISRPAGRYVDPGDVTTSSDDRDEGEPEIDLLPA